MEDILRGFCELLKTHSQQVIDWITILEQRKSISYGEDGSNNKVQISDHSFKSKVQPTPIGQVTRKPNIVDQGDLETVSSIIEDTELKIKSLEISITVVLKLMEKDYQKKSEPATEVREREEATPSNRHVIAPAVPPQDHSARSSMMHQVDEDTVQNVTPGNRPVTVPAVLPQNQTDRSSAVYQSYGTTVNNATPSNQPVIAPAVPPQDHSARSSMIHQIDEDTVKNVTPGNRPVTVPAVLPQNQTDRLPAVYQSYGTTVNNEGLPVVQVYARGNYTKDVVSSLTERLQHKFLLVETQSVTDIDKGKPLLILCQLMSRIQPDLKYAVEEFATLDDLHASIIIVHYKEEHALPETSSQFQITRHDRYKSLRLIDAAYTKESKLYPCKMNSEALKKLDDFVSSTETKHE